MTLSNEQRAHDLAVASLPFMKEQVDEAISNGENIVFDVYVEYKKLYNLFLVAVTKDFPNQD